MFCQHGVTIHGLVWHYLSEIGHFHYMMDEHISEYNSFEAFCISVCSSLHTRAYPPSLRASGLPQAAFTFWSSCWLLRVIILGHTPSPRASDLPQVSFTFRSSCWPLRVVILGHTPFSESIGPFSRLSFTFWSSCWPPRVAYWGIPSFPKIIGPFTCFIIFWPSCWSSWVVRLGHIPSGRVFLHRYLGYPLALGHLIRSFIILSVWIFKLGLHLYRLVIRRVSLRFGAAPISIDHVPITFRV